MLRKLCETQAKMECGITNLGISEAEGGSSFGARFLSGFSLQIRWELDEEIVPLKVSLHQNHQESVLKLRLPAAPHPNPLPRPPAAILDFLIQQVWGGT